MTPPPIASLDDVDVRPRPPEWKQVIDLVDGARQRGFTEPQLEYLRACIGITWAKAYGRGRADERDGAE